MPREGYKLPVREGLGSHSGFYSFQYLLRAACKVLEPKTAVEWGPGYSTEILLENPETKVYSWENNIRYFNIVKNIFEKDERSEINYVEWPELHPGKQEPYAMGPLLKFEPGTIDLCFVDGRDRASSLLAAYYLVSENGAVVVHDFNRHPFRLVDIKFPFVYRCGKANTGLLTKNEKVMDDILKQYEITYPYGIFKPRDKTN